ncbi:SIR2 family protein [Serinicoccus kebangsaanensis]|uniref:SIR2 family protein n=1 Tax=Serinicoccus kebangsaanensis TaxID=2602069 RepID=UPI00124CA07B|nr:SIR2 family protein [Serinicoccus kebangsaanensis]
MSSTNIAAVCGNGVSIAFNPDLALSSINTELRARLNENYGEGEAPAQVLVDLADTVANDDDPNLDFEALLGPLDQMWNALGVLRRYANVVGPRDRVTAEHLVGSYEFLRKARRTGISHALDIIAERSVAHFDDRLPLRPFVEALFDATGDFGNLTVGNLNYDNILQACFLDRYKGQVCDLASGANRMLASSLTEASGSSNIPCFQLRDELDFPRYRRIRLLPLHGSLNWAYSPKDHITVKFDIGTMRAADFWKSWRNGETDLEPKVVLTNQPTKSKVVLEHPFSLAYQGLREALLTSDHWVIAGYSFRDACVNQLLADVIEQRGHLKYPKILVVTHGNDLSEMQVKTALGVTLLHDVIFDRESVIGVQDRRAWGRWMGPTPLAAVS